MRVIITAQIIPKIAVHIESFIFSSKAGKSESKFCAILKKVPTNPIIIKIPGVLFAIYARFSGKKASKINAIINTSKIIHVKIAAVLLSVKQLIIISKL